MELSMQKAEGSMSSAACGVQHGQLWQVARELLAGCSGNWALLNGPWPSMEKPDFSCVKCTPYLRPTNTLCTGPQALSFK